ncbi:hypothetical protein H2198_002089 [Neophaeococcomyces mojaviensis]|uniref:Uncharacterized protein n=1 Tax=Neophaeococcomyces mojaviensis TaxID=3383035 RepID=A0ACC3AF05_9EURO|nr:hypothetical protein H2198_002089 [Knufia sp. JES_112]
MRVFLIRHGETEHNVAGLLAGATDSRLTNHGLIQAQRLASYLVKRRHLQFTHIFASDLQRAHRTANEISNAQSAARPEDAGIGTTVLPLLREQDFGSFELLPWKRSQDLRLKDPSPEDPGFKPKETHAALKLRADAFVDDYLLPLLALDDEWEQDIAVVSHGLLLGALWKALLIRFRPSTVSLSPDVVLSNVKRSLENLPAWSNTGFLELHICSAQNTWQDTATTEENSSRQPKSTEKLDATMTICAVNGKEHLAHLKRTRGGVGSTASDERQQRLESFFKKRKVDTTPKPSLEIRDKTTSL